MQRILLKVGLGLLLAGCWSSERPLFEAERFLSVRHIVTIAPFYSLERIVEEPSAEEVMDEPAEAE